MRWHRSDGTDSGFLCCFCCHVRTGTFILGAVNLVVELFGITIALIAAIRPDLCKCKTGIHSADYDTLDVNSSASNDSLRWWHNNPNWSASDQLVGLVLSIASVFFTVSLLYGVLKAIPKFLLPFFCLQVFDFCVSCLILVGFFSYEQNVRTWLSQQNWLPLRDQLLALGNGWLMLISGLTAIIILWIKAYCISVVWSCYKYLMQSRAVQATSSLDSTLSPFGIPLAEYLHMRPNQYCTPENMSPNALNSEMMLPPKYEDLVEMQDMNVGTIEQPPSYTAACGAAAQNSVAVNVNPQHRETV